MKKLLIVSILFVSFSSQAQWVFNANGTGVETATNNASGYYSVAGGNNSTASGNNSTAMGSISEAIGDYSIAMGSNARATSYSSIAIGSSAQAVNNWATAIGNQTAAIGEYSTAIGDQTTASGQYSTAMGRRTTASGQYSTAMGGESTASYWYSTAMGFSTTSSGVTSTSMGYGTTASDFGTLAIGSYNTIDPTPNPSSFALENRALVIGNAEFPGNPSDAFTVLFSGETTIAGNVTAPFFIGDGSLLTNLPVSGSDDQNILGSGLAGTTLTIGIEGGTSENVDLSSLQDGTGTDDQVLSLVGNSLELEDGGNVNLDTYLDNTDSQNISGSELAGTTLIIGIEDGTSENVDLSSLNNPGTDNQVLSLNGNSLELEDGGSVDLSDYLDNTDNQNISGSGLAGTMLTIGIDGGVSENVDLSSLQDGSGTDDQVLSLVGNTLELEDGGNVNLAAYLDNTDSQNISGSGLAGTTLTIGIEGGASENVDLSVLDDSGTDDQNLTSAVLNGNILKIGIEDGNIVQVDLTPLIGELQDENNDQQAQINDLIARMEAREDCECSPFLGNEDFDNRTNLPYLIQNVPNPFKNTTSIGYFIPLSYSKANLVLSTTTGQLLKSIPINNFGEGSIEINKDRLASAIYYYSLYVDGKKVDTKRMIVE